MLRIKVNGIGHEFSGDPDMYLKPGDVVEAEVERLGDLRTPVVSWQEGHGTPVPAKVDW